MINSKKLVSKKKTHKVWRTFITLLWLTLLLGTFIYMFNATIKIEKQKINSINYSNQSIVTVTLYNNNQNQTDKDPLITASGFYLTKSNLENLECIKGDYGIVSVSRDLLLKYPYGSIIFVDNKNINKEYGRFFVVLDTLNERYTSTIDILVSKESLINKWENIVIFELK